MNDRAHLPNMIVLARSVCSTVEIAENSSQVSTSLVFLLRTHLWSLPGVSRQAAPVQRSHQRVSPDLPAITYRSEAKSLCFIDYDRASYELETLQCWNQSSGFHDSKYPKASEYDLRRHPHQKRRYTPS